MVCGGNNMFGCNLGIPEFQEKLEGSIYKAKLYAEWADELAKAELAWTSDKIIIQF